MECQKNPQMICPLNIEFLSHGAVAAKLRKWIYAVKRDYLTLPTIWQGHKLVLTMLNISFEPPLRAETRVRPAIQGDATIKITSHACLDASEWHRLEQGASVELWSDIPANGRKSGEWGATKFVKSGPETDTVLLEASLITLSSRGTNSPPRFSYTYRVRHSSGEIQWLGSSNSNGHIVLDSESFWSPSEDPTSTAIGTLNWATRWKGWLLSPERAPAKLTLLSLNARETSPAAQVLLLVPGSARREASQPPSLVLRSTSAPINVSHGKIYCETPKDVTVETIPEDSSIVDILKTHGILSLPTSESEAFFVLSSQRAPGQLSTLFHPVWLSPRIPTTVRVSSSDIKSVTGSSEATVIYPPGQGFSQPFMVSEGEHEIPLANGSEPLRVVLLQSMPNSENQLVGVATPSTIFPAHPPASPASPTLTAVDASASATTKAASGKHDGTKNFATVTVSKSSNVLFAHTVAIPDIVTFQIERLLRFKLLYTFYRLALYIASLVMPFLGIHLSLKIAPPPELETPGLAPEAEQETGQGEKEKEVNALETREEPTSDYSLYYDVEPMGGEVHVTFLGDAADEVSFTVDGNKIDPWSIVQTWHGDDLHQFLLKMDAPSRLGVSIQPATTE